MQTRVTHAWLLSLALISLLGCASEGPASLRWNIVFGCPDDAARTANIKLRVWTDVCQGNEVVYETNLLRGKSAPTEVLTPGAYFFEVLAYDDRGELVAGDCQERNLPGDAVEFPIRSPACVLAQPMDGGDPGGDSDIPDTIDPLPFDSGTPDVGGSNDAGGAPACTLTANNCVCRQHGDHSYLFCPDAVDWAGARERCRAQRGDLVVIETAEENAFLVANGGSGRWLGANDRGDNGLAGGACPGLCNKTFDEGTWRWVDAVSNQEHGVIFCEASKNSSNCSAKGYMNWAPKEPNNADGAGCIPYFACGIGEDCATMGTNGTWQDVSCSAKQPFICESF